MSRVVYPARETVTEIRGADPAGSENGNHQTESEQIDFWEYEI